MKKRKTKFVFVLIGFAVAFIVAAFAVSSCIDDRYDLDLIDWNTFKDSLYIDIIKNQINENS